MHKSHLRKVGGSVMLSLPPSLLEVVQLGPGATVGITVRGGRLVIEPQPRPRYSLDELLAQCNPKARRGAEEREWVTGTPIGNEII
jgi:antitoxin ChpS